ncbi:hypothetical protein ABB37_03526 [Leptomonas pyrrhocoris]|uniref:Transmembrane protein n=1 Tax=Leptomonas pyrrhocoris TaxID=157538 RepID=A0A0N1J515_LEPPY|nr:hypothetical protein ABB37_03526 [Leptomonas pyrrhocoris]KPA82464.1 hypothetical protein ABB37_03526 [Leptomonas pyrrhocoris]|eukprot:XP_015660903.1 hypothetical protein ABB37_03526 [Leptomonas pyrrhocoris]
MSMQKYTLVTAVVACGPAIFAVAQGESAASTTTTTTKTPVPVNLGQNIVTTVLILGVTTGVTLVYVLTKLIPKMRRGEISLSKIEFDWRAELLNQTSKKEKARRAEEMAVRRYGEVDESGMRTSSETQPRVQIRGADKADEADKAAEEIYSSRNTREEEDAHVTFPREHRE